MVHLRTVKYYPLGSLRRWSDMSALEHAGLQRYFVALLLPSVSISS